MYPDHMSSLQGHNEAGIPGLSGMPGMPFSTPFGLPPPVTSSSSGMSMLLGNHTQMGNLTAIYATLANMTAVEILTTVQSFLVASLMRQYMFNDFFAGGLGLMLIGALGANAQSLLSRLLAWLRQPKGCVQIRIGHDSEAYKWVQEWLTQFTRLSSTHYDVECSWGNEDGSEDYGDQAENDRPKVKLFPEFKSAQNFKYKGETIWVQTSTQATASGGGGGGGGGEDNLLKLLQGGKGKEDLLLSASSKSVLEEVVKDAMETYFKKEDESRVTKVFRWSCDELYWVHVGARKVRPVSSVILDCKPDALLDDAKRFLSSEAWYADRGIPHRRGYLLHGPPGCGKTSLIKVLAGELKLDVSLISLSSKDLSDDMLQMAMNRLPHRSIFVLEDVDAAFGSDGRERAPSREGSDTEGASARVGFTRNSLSFSGLLNAIDGITAQEGSIVVMTTNHIHKLDAALIRPGRIDLRLYLGLASTTQACGIFRRFYPDASAEQEARVAAAIPPGTVSPAGLQGLFLEHRDDLGGMLSRLGDFVSEARGGKGDVQEVGGKAETQRRKDKRSKRSKDRRREVAESMGEEVRETERSKREEGGDELVGEHQDVVQGEDIGTEDRKSSGDEMEREGWETVSRAQKKGSKR